MISKKTSLIIMTLSLVGLTIAGVGLSTTFAGYVKEQAVEQQVGLQRYIFLDVTNWDLNDVEEDYYVALVDQVFHHGERAQKDAADRWRRLWTSESAGGAVTEAMADFSTMRLSGNNLIYWEWQETKGKDGELMDVKFMKKALNHEQGTEKIVSAKHWTSAAGWKKLETDGRYETIPKEDKAYPGLERLRAIVKGYQYWLNRYRTDLPQTENGKKSGK